MMKHFLPSVFLTIVVSILLIRSGGLLFLSVQKPIDPNSLTGTFDSKADTAVFNNSPVPVPNYVVDGPPPTQSKVLGDSTAKKQIRIDLTQQRLFAYEGDHQVFSFYISSGKWHPTPTGTFHIWTKLRYTGMEGGSKALHTYYNLPNVPFTMFMTGENMPKTAGYAIHGTYWHNNFGHPMSHGCINMKTSEVEQLYYWANPDLRGGKSIAESADNPGTEVIIYGEAPKE